MGKHSAADGAVVHPIVATALEQRTRSVPDGRPTDAAVGWPQEPRRGAGVGWPTGPEPLTTGHDPVPEPTADAADGGSVLAVLDAAAQGVEAAPVSEPPPMRRSGWRRIFGGGGGGSPSAA